jgi:hypothetical protein
MTSDNFDSLVKNRARIHKFLLDLYRFSETDTTLEQNEVKRDVFYLLVGAAFSLWRAAFLCDTNRTWCEIIKDAKLLLEKVIRDNAINYPQDRETRAWTVGYYLNSARLRVAEARDILKVTSGRELLRFKQLEKNGIESQKPNDLWDTIYNASQHIFKKLEKLR